MIPVEPVKLREDMMSHNYDSLFEYFEYLVDYFCKFIPHNPDKQMKIRQQFDLDLLRNMLIHNACEINDFRTIVEQLRVTFKSFAMPSRDRAIDEILNRLLSEDILKASNQEDVVNFFIEFTMISEFIIIRLYQDYLQYLESERFKNDMEILTSENGQKWLKNKKE